MAKKSSNGSDFGTSRFGIEVATAMGVGVGGATAELGVVGSG